MLRVEIRQIQEKFDKLNKNLTELLTIMKYNSEVKPKTLTQKLINLFD